MNKIASLFSIAVISFLLASCGNDDIVAGNDGGSSVIRVMPAPMTIVGEEVPYGSRATSPLRPEYENTIYSLTVLVFDKKEGVLRYFPATDGRRKLYKYINLKDENGNGLLAYTLAVKDFPVVANEEYTVCLIANFSETQVEDMVNSMLGDGTVFFDEFKNYAVEIPYVNSAVEDDGGTMLEMGHVRDIYMFGFYEGEVTTHSDITISLGRLIARLELVLAFDHSKIEKDKTICMKLENKESHANLFPTGKSPGHYVEQEIYRISSLDELVNTTNYFYVAPNSALSKEQSLTLKMWYVPIDMPLDQVGQQTPNAVVYLCNDRPGVEGRNYQLNRNSVYRFVLNLK